MGEGLAPYLMILFLAALPTQVWRWLGVYFAGQLDEGSAAFEWVKCVATALVAAVIAKLILFPGGALAELAIPVRLAAVALGFAVYRASGQRLALGLLAAEAVLLVGWFTTL